MVRMGLLTLMGMFLFGLNAPPAEAQQAMCGDRTAIVETLEKEYSETPVAFGMAGTDQLLEVFASPRGSWTILISKPEGTSCVMAAGENWEDMHESKEAGLKI